MTDKKVISWLLKTVGKFKVYIIIMLLLQMIVNGGAVCYALVLKKMIDCAVAGNKDGFFRGLFIFSAMMIIIMLMRLVLRQIEESARSGMENSYKSRLFRTLLSKDYGKISKVHSEEWMNRITSDTAVCANGMTEILPGFIGMAVRMTGTLVLMFLLQPVLTYFIIPGGILFVVITLFLRKYLKSQHKKVQEKDGAVRVYLQERISNMIILRTFGAENKALSGAEEKFSEHRKVRKHKALISGLCGTGFSLVINGMYIIGIGCCGYGIIKGSVSYGTLTAIIQLIGQLQAPLSGISGYVPRFYGMLASAERLIDAEKLETTDVFSFEKDIQKFYNNDFCSIELKNVSFSYDADPVLNNINFSIRKGDFIAITGLSGCGKSTLLKLIMGIYKPVSGTVDVKLISDEQIPVSSFKGLFAFVPQSNCLMNGTIRDVITFEDKQVSSDELAKAVEISCADFIHELHDGLDTQLGEKGNGLSEGQMQRIAIARAIYNDAPVLILDEATSALDIETERRLLYNIRKLTYKTVFIVTHRPEALKICNKQLTFDDDTISLNYHK